jgi:hypothetical protein
MDNQKYIQLLEEQNKMLSHKLEIAKEWMKRGIDEKKNKIGAETNFYENFDALIKEKINDFFSEIILINFPSDFIDNIISSEINFHNMQRDEHIDGIVVILGYQKILDFIIEENITKEFRKFAIQQGLNTLERGNPLEKSLFLVVEKWYSLSIGRLYNILKNIRDEQDNFPYKRCFENFLKKYASLGKLLLGNSFFSQLEILVESEVLWEKRHKGSIDFEAVKQARKILIGNFEDKNCIIYSLLEYQNINF